jgi:hypothetical protein
MIREWMDWEGIDGLAKWSMAYDTAHGLYTDIRSLTGEERADEGQASTID